MATSSPRRFLVADEVGLGKTIETALVLRELASRGELKRALMVVPAGLVNNWHRELNEVFNLDFEVFGSRRGRDRPQIERLRQARPADRQRRYAEAAARIKRLLEAPPWDLVVFDEAHHLTAYSGAITQDRELQAGRGAQRPCPRPASAFRHAAPRRPLPLLDADPASEPDAVQRPRTRWWRTGTGLNAVVFRRTKADACTPDGSPLFARRWVHTESFVMSDGEREFYAKLQRIPSGRVRPGEAARATRDGRWVSS